MNRMPYISLVLTVLLAAACTKPMLDTGTSDSQSTSRSYIFFEPEIIEVAETRADILFEYDSFGVMGFAGNSTVFSDHTGGKAEVTKEGDLYTYSPLAQWQGSQNHNFYGFYPYSLSSSVNSGADNIPYITYTQPTTLASMVDVMTAKTGPITKRSYVTLNFTHRLWALDVKVKNSQTRKVTLYNPATGQDEEIDPDLTVQSILVEISGVPSSANLSLNGTTISNSTPISSLSQSFTLNKELASTEEVTINGSDSFLFIPCNGFNYRLTINFKNAWGVEYSYHYPETYKVDAEGNMLPDANGNTQWNWKQVTKNFTSGYRYTLTVEKVDAEGSFEFSWVTSSWGEWDEEKQEWINIDVEHTFE